MPNWCFNTITITAKTAKEIKAIVEFVKGDKAEDGDVVPSVFDFKKILPQPAELVKRQFGGEDIQHSDNEEHKALVAVLNAKYGSSSLYDWNCANWDTKWNACEAEMTEFVIKKDKASKEKWNGYYVQYRLDTAWSPPVNVMRKLSELFEDVLVELYFTEEAKMYPDCEMDFVNGVMISEKELDDCHECGGDKLKGECECPEEEDDE
jgi:hypothetical protein